MQNLQSQNHIFVQIDIFPNTYAIIIQLWYNQEKRLRKGGMQMLGVYLAMLGTDAQKQRFETLYYQNKTLMYRTAYHILNNNQNAEDAVHDAFVSAANQIDKIITKNDVKCYHKSTAAIHPKA